MWQKMNHQGTKTTKKTWEAMGSGSGFQTPSAMSLGSSLSGPAYPCSALVILVSWWFDIV
jgi:hypothetical protein